MEFLNNHFTVLFCSSWAESNFKLTLLLNEYFHGWAACRIQTLNLMPLFFFPSFYFCSINTYLEPGQHSLCTAQECKQWMFLFEKKSTVVVNRTNDAFVMWLGLLQIHTRHVNHPAVAVLQQVPGLTVDAAGADAVCGEVLGVYGCGLAVTPRWWEILKLQQQTAHIVSQRVSRTGWKENTRQAQGRCRGRQQADKTQHTFQK